MLVWTCLFAALGGFLFGYDLGLIGGALLQIQRHFAIRSTLLLEVIVGAAKLGAAVGSLLGGAAMARYGRSRALAASAVAFAAGPLLMAAAAAPWLLVCGRLVTGVGIGVSAAVAPTYIAELAPARSRGALVQLYEAMLCAGTLAAPLADWALRALPSGMSWRLMVGLPALPGLALAAAPLLLPESPRWLVTRNRLDEALHVLTQLYGGGDGGGTTKGAANGGYARVPGKEPALSRGGAGGRGGVASTAGSGAGTRPQAALDAEDELLALWSSVERDKFAVLERRRLWWRARAQPGGAPGYGRLGLRLTAWSWSRGRPKPPQLEPIPEEHHDLLRSESSVESSPLARHPRRRGSRECGLLGDSEGSDSSHGGCDGGGPACSAEGGAPGAKAAGAPVAGIGSGAGAGGGVVARLGAGGHRLSTAGSTLAQPVAPARPLPGTPAVVEDASAADLAGAGAPAAVRGPDPTAGQCGTCNCASADGPSSLSAMPGEEASLAATLRAMATDLRVLAAGPEGRALRLALGLAVFDQITASTAIINYAPSLLRDMAATAAASSGGGAAAAGPGGAAAAEGGAMLYGGALAAAKAVGVCTALLLVDVYGRRPLLVGGSLACAAALAAAAAAGLVWQSVPALAASLAMFTLAFSLSWAGLYWVVVSELFSMSSKSAATAAANALLFLAGAGTNMVFLTLREGVGNYVFLLFAAISLASGVYVHVSLPETRGRTLADIQALLARGGVGRAAGCEPLRGGSGGAPGFSGGDSAEGGLWVQLEERKG